MKETSGGVDGAPLVYLGYWHGKWYGGDRKCYDSLGNSTDLYYAPDVGGIFCLTRRHLSFSEVELRMMAREERWKEYCYQLTGKRPQTMKGWGWKVVREAIIDMRSGCAGEFDTSRLRKAGIWQARIDGEDGLAYNNGNRLYFLPVKKRAFRTLGLYQPPYIYTRSRYPGPRLDWNPDGDSTPLSTEDSARVLNALQKQPWAGDAQLEGAELGGWIYSSLFTAIPMAAEQLPCGMTHDFASWKPQIWLTGTMTIAKRALVEDVEHILGIRGDAILPYLIDAKGALVWNVLWQLLSDTAGPVIYTNDDEEGDLSDKMKQYISYLALTARSCAKSALTAHLDDGKYRICNSFCLVTDKRLTYSASGEFRLTELRLKDTTWAREEKLAAALADVRKMIDAPEFTARFILRCMMVYPLYRETFTALTAYFVEKFEHGEDYIYDSQMIRHAQLIAGAHAMRADEPMTAEEMAGWAEMVRAKMLRENEATRAEWGKYLSRRR